MEKKLTPKPSSFFSDPKVREKLVPLAVVVIVGIGSLLFGGQLLAGIEQRTRLIKTAKTKVVVLENKRDVLAGSSDAALTYQVGQLENLLPSSKPALNLLVSLSRLARQERVILSAITLNPGKVAKPKEETETTVERSGGKIEAPRVQDFTLEFSAEGSLQQVGNFITGLEKTAPVMKIEEFNLGLASVFSSPLGRTEPGTGNVKVKLLVKVFHQEPPESIGGVESPLADFSQEEKDLLERLGEFTISPPIQPLAPVGKSNLFGSSF